ncbi:MAG: hypothetical protein Tsb007_12390 [Rhizobacter sp.]
MSWVSSPDGWRGLRQGTICALDCVCAHIKHYIVFFIARLFSFIGAQAQTNHPGMPDALADTQVLAKPRHLAQARARLRIGRRRLVDRVWGARPEGAGGSGARAAAASGHLQQELQQEQALCR